MSKIQFKTIKLHVDRGYYSLTSTKLHCQKSHQNIFNGIPMGGCKLNFSHLPFKDAVLIRFVENVLTNDRFSSNLDL